MSKEFWGWGQEPYPDDSPVLLSFDIDLGWIVESVNNGEYEVQNLPLPGEKNEKPDFDFAIKEAKDKMVRVRYYPLTGGTK